ncbi:MAG: YfcE family phosphodiesterase [Clostridiales bacterium]|nr:YfcE family phosphodiesterase [Clostridiales bacterium]
MRIIVTSDSHGNRRLLFDIIEKHIEQADLFINLGDSNSGLDLKDAKIFYKSRLNIKEVRGNCDWSSSAPDEQLINAGGKRILFCHGHTYYVKMGYDDILNAAENKKADIAVFGHTHIPFHDYINGIHLFNPGAVENSDYGIIDITTTGIVCINAHI